MEKLEVKIDGPVSEIIYREGEAAPIVEPVKLEVTGDIRTVGLFIAGRSMGDSLQSIHPAITIIESDLEKGTIWLRTDPNNKYGSSVKGTLLPSDELKGFCINEAKTFSQKEFLKLLKFSRNYFPDQAQHADLLQKYTAIVFTTETGGHAEADDRGNKNTAHKRKVETNVPQFFTLKAPLYKGERPVSFRVEICLDVTDGGGAKFWLESTELHELQQTEKAIVFDRELKLCEGLMVIHK